MSKPKYHIVRTLFRIEVIKTYYDSGSKKWITETIGTTETVEEAKMMLSIFQEASDD